jgi:hypothetical protein
VVVVKKKKKKKKEREREGGGERERKKNDIFNNTKENIGVKSALVSLVKHNHRVLAELWVYHCLSQKHTI